MTKQRRSLAYLAEYEFGDDNILTTTYLEEARLLNEQRVKQARSVLDTEADERTVNNAKRIQQEQDREIEITQHNQILLQRLERIHKKLPKQFDFSHHTEEHLNAHRPTNFHVWQREQERIADENKKMKRRLNQTKSLFDTKQLAVEAAKHRHFSKQLSKAERRLQLKQKCKQLELQINAKQFDTDHHTPKVHHRRKRHHMNKLEHDNDQHSMEGVHECHPDHRESRRDSRQLPRVRASHKMGFKYATPPENFPTVTNTSKLIRAADLLPRLT